jgi:ATP-binding cassette subfamily C protein
MEDKLHNTSHQGAIMPGTIDTSPPPPSEEEIRALARFFADGARLALVPADHAALAAFAGPRLLLSGQAHLYAAEGDAQPKPSHGKLDYLGALGPGEVLPPVSGLRSKTGMDYQLYVLPAESCQCLELSSERFTAAARRGMAETALALAALRRFLALLTLARDSRRRSLGRAPAASAGAYLLDGASASERDAAPCPAGGNDFPQTPSKGGVHLNQRRPEPEAPSAEDAFALPADAVCGTPRRLAAVLEARVKPLLFSLRLAEGRRQADAARRDREALRKEDRRFEATLTALGAAAETPAQTQAGAGVLPGDDPLLFALSRLAVAYGVDFDADLCPAPRRAPDPVARLEEAARLLDWRLRRVRLESGFPRLTTEPLIGFKGPERLPALLRLKGGASVWLNPENGREEPLDEHAAADFADFAYRFYEQLPARPLNLRDLLRFGLARAKPALRDLLRLGLLAGLLGMAMPLGMEYVTGKIIPTASRAELWQLLALLVPLTVSGVILGLAPQLRLLAYNTAQTERCEAAVFDRLFRLRLGFFREHDAGDLCSRLGAFAEVQNTVFSILCRQAGGASFALVNLCLLLHYGPRLALAGIAATLLYGAALSLLMRRAMPHLSTAAQSQGRLAGSLKQFLDGVAVIRGAGAEKSVITHYMGEYLPMAKAGFAVNTLAARLAVMSVIFPTLLSMIFFWMVGSRLAGDMNMPQYLAFTAAFGAFQQGVLGLFQGLWELWGIKPAVERIRPILEAESEQQGGRMDPGRLDGSLSLRHVVFRYAPDHPPVLDDVSLEAAPGECIAIAGPSGSGKSTLVRILLGFERPESGGVFYGGQDLAALDLKATRRQFGVVLQQSRVFPGSILDNITAGAPLDLEQARRAAADAALDRDLADMPMGIHTMVGPGLLSGGQEQRVLIARALAGDPVLLLLDEATSALDNLSQKSIQETIESMRATRVIIAHRLSTIEGADRIYVLDKGKVAEVGTYAELMDRDGLFKRLALRQIV